VDPEAKYEAAALLASVGAPQQALELLRGAIENGYCFFPALDADSSWDSLRGDASFREIREAARGCRERFERHREASSPGRAVPGE